MRGITPIIAIILLLLMAVAAAGAAYLWITLMQSTITGETQSGLESNIAQMQRQLTIPSVWNDGEKINMIVKNAGSSAYTQAQMKDITVYINNAAYQWDSTPVDTMPTDEDFGSGDTLAIQVCNSTQAGGGNCTGPVEQGYDYTLEDIIDVRVEPPIGAGGTYNNYQSS